ncbi:MAG: enoyl-CoA hydratase/isomerase family protein [Steroidobacteraceae bacterium]
MLEIHDHGAVRELRLAHPPVNALGSALIQRLTAELGAARDAGARAIVLSGQPGLFSAGLDVRELTSLSEEGVRHFVTGFAALQERLARLPIPIVAAITGQCPAGGTVLALYCDHRIMARGPFRIGLNEVQVGLYPSQLLFRAFERLVGTGRAASLLPRGALIDPETALAAGLVEELCPPEQVVPRALALAAELVALPPLAYTRTRELVRRDLVKLFDEPEEDAAKVFGAGIVTDETRIQMKKLLAKPG